MASNFTQKTSKDKESLIQENYQYYFKTLNKDTSKHYVCAKPNCFSSITVFNEEVIKINGKQFDLYTSDFIKTGHKNNHRPLNQSELINLNFRKN